MSSYRSSMLLSLILLIYLNRAAVHGLLCHCDICADKNDTCSTDGYCFATTSLQKETGVITHTYRCRDSGLIYPPKNPLFCSNNNALNDTFVIGCCKDRDMCNKDWKPSLHVKHNSVVTCDDDGTGGDGDATGDGDEIFPEKYEPRAKSSGGSKSTNADTSMNDAGKANIEIERPIKCTEPKKAVAEPKTRHIVGKADEFHSLKMRLLQDEYDAKMLLIERQREIMEEEHNLRIEILKMQKRNLNMGMSSGNGSGSIHLNSSEMGIAPPQTSKKEMDSSYNLVPGLGYYKMHNRQLKWNAAREVCATEGAHLLILNSDAEWEVVKQIWDNSTFASNPYMLTGMSDFAQEGIFVTLFGNPISMTGYNKWDSGEPGEGISASCGYINKKGLLHDGVCDADYNNRPFICEVPLP